MPASKQVIQLPLKVPKKKDTEKIFLCHLPLEQTDAGVQDIYQLMQEHCKPFSCIFFKNGKKHYLSHRRKQTNFHPCDSLTQINDRIAPATNNLIVDGPLNVAS